MDKQRLESLSLFRYRLRRFLRFSEDAARGEGITALHYQLLLHAQGFPGRDWASIRELAELAALAAVVEAMQSPQEGR